MADIKKGDHKFYIGDDEQNPKAEITYKESGTNELNVDHTYVSDELRGEGIGGKLVEKMVSYARNEGKTIDPTCPYAKQKMEETPAYQDVLAE
ncbi:GNAT family N-acetyltransferase [Lentibacillus salicampi]|uniref:N-acetyltransferase n=1 Tax=Lentibacillus salicampi TaxID=175306 RepID=A0A4Y9A6K7_9BACI|nr:GNAT family N-acetyltransferase [Lentibacillus salicampi]TFJ91298.1 N-acetyltransferase [Lentibacillus salicampi]